VKNDGRNKRKQRKIQKKGRKRKYTEVNKKRKDK
jgi:hypothetical protein